MHRPPLLPLVLGSIALAAWLQARGFSAIAGGGLAAPVLRPLLPDPPPLPAPPSRSADAILARNVFDSVTGPLLGAPELPAASAGAHPLGACAGVRVVSIVASDDPDGSLAMLDVHDPKGPILRRRGGEVLAIAPDRVLLDRGAGPCVARMFAPALASAGSAASRPSSPSGAASAVAKGIAQTAPDAFVVDRAARDALLEGAADVMRSVAIRPEKNGDDVIGLRIAVLTPGTPLDALGVRGGDVLLSMEGIPLTAPDRMLEAYARARTDDALRLVLIRDGRTIQLDYTVR
ncbi:MAG TPA: type II secretion system protein GspC [Polyangiaceae bacterium]|jgi:general secretion pathway protein C